MDEIKPVAWYCTESNDGKYKFRDPFLSTNAAYVEAHKGYDWATLYDQQAIDTLRRSLEFYRRRSEALQAIQHHMRDPERKAVCDILANGQTYVYADTAK